MEKGIRIEREQLYEDVWSEPITKLAQKYQISDVGLLKICRKLEIPVPGRGYWAKKKKEKRPPLPPLKGRQSYFIHEVQHQERSTQTDYDEEIKALIAFEKVAENKITVPSRLSSPHPLIAQTQMILEPPKENSVSIPPGLKNKCLDVRVSHKSLPRALRIYDALLKAMEERGFEVLVNSEKHTVVTILGESVRIILEEIFKQQRRRLTPEERIKELTGGWISDRFVMVPTNELRLRLEADFEGLQKQWADGKEQRLENCLNSFIIGTIKASAEAKRKRIEWEKRRQEQMEQERIRFEKWEQQEEEKRQLERLEKEIEAWNRSQNIRNYIEAVRQYVLKKHGSIEPNSKAYKWIQWATKIADRLDPLVQDT